MLRLFGGKRSPDSIIEREHAVEVYRIGARSFQVILIQQIFTLAGDLSAGTVRQERRVLIPQ